MDNLFLFIVWPVIHNWFNKCAHLKRRMFHKKATLNLNIWNELKFKCVMSIRVHFVLSMAINDMSIIVIPFWCDRGIKKNAILSAKRKKENSCIANRLQSALAWMNFRWWWYRCNMSTVAHDQCVTKGDPIYASMRRHLIRLQSQLNLTKYNANGSSDCKVTKAFVLAFKTIRRHSVGERVLFTWKKKWRFFCARKMFSLSADF